MARRRRSADAAAAPDRRSSGEVVEVSGRVVRLLSDDDDAERHQRFVIRIGGGQTVLVAHNLTLADRVPVGLGDRVDVRGVYEWSDLGGLVHWTHRDPMGNEEGGYVRFAGKEYA